MVAVENCSHELGALTDQSGCQDAAVLSDCVEGCAEHAARWFWSLVVCIDRVVIFCMRGG